MNYKFLALKSNYKPNNNGHEKPLPLEKKDKYDNNTINNNSISSSSSSSSSIPVMKNALAIRDFENLNKFKKRYDLNKEDPIQVCHHHHHH